MVCWCCFRLNRFLKERLLNSIIFSHMFWIWMEKIKKYRKTSHIYCVVFRRYVLLFGWLNILMKWLSVWLICIWLSFTSTSFFIHWNADEQQLVLLSCWNNITSTVFDISTHMWYLMARRCMNQSINYWFTSLNCKSRILNIYASCRRIYIYKERQMKWKLVVQSGNPFTVQCQFNDKTYQLIRLFKLVQFHSNS